MEKQEKQNVQMDIDLNDIVDNLLQKNSQLTLENATLSVMVNKLVEENNELKAQQGPDN